MAIENKLATKRWRTHFYSKNIWNNGWLNGANLATVGSYRNLVRTPNYRSARAQGLDVTNSYTNEKYSARFVKGLMSYELRVDPFNVGYQYCETSSGPHVDPGVIPLCSATAIERARNAAAVIVLKKIKKTQTSYSGFTILGELRETVHMLRSPLSSLRTAVDKWHKPALSHYERYTKARGKRKRDIAKVISDTWLEFAFGVQPLINDIFDILNAACEVKTTRVRRCFGIASAEESSVMPSGYNCGGYMIWGYDAVDSKQVEVKYSCGVWETDNTDRTPYLRARDSAGFQLAEIIPAAWELVPWSFLVDYFSNIGDVLDAATSSTRNVCYSSKTTAQITTRIHSNWFADYRYDPFLYRTVKTVNPAAEGTHTKITRVKEMPGLSLEAIRLSMPGPGRKYLNMAALASSTHFRR